MKQSTADPITMVYHELRGPLGLMATAARSAADECTDEALRARCEVIVRAAERMLRTAGHVIDLAHKSESACSELYDPAETIRATVSDLSEMSVPLILTSLPSEAPCLAEGNVALLEALVQSLITNASDHSEPGTSIHVVLSERSGKLRVEVVNQRSSVRRHRGLGLGLYICQNLAGQLGASLTCDPCGEHFRSVLTLPLTKERAILVG